MKSSTLLKTRSQTGLKGLRAAGILVVLLIIQLNLVGQTTIYIDPTNSASGQNGTIQNPYSGWNQVSYVNGNTYLQKRGTTYNTTGSITITGKSNITLGAYGTGAKPIIKSSASAVRVIRLTNSTNCNINNLDLSSTSSTVGQAAILFDGTSGNNLIDSCVLHACEWGIRMTVAVGTIGNRILHTEVHDIGDDGIYAKDVKDIEIGFCNVYDVNRKYLINPDQSYSAGDCIQLTGNPNTAYPLYVNIHDNTLDHSNMGNKFCLIIAGEYYYGDIERNVMTGGNSTSAMYFGQTTGTLNIIKNTMQSSNYAIYSYVHDLQVHYNKIINNNLGISIQASSLTQTSLTAYNNTFYNNDIFCIGASNSSTTIVSKNNSFYLTGSSAKAYQTGSSSVTSNNNNFNIQQSGFINSYGTLAAWQSATGDDLNSFVGNPMFVNPSAGDFHIQLVSPCINSGSNLNLTSDFYNTSVPQGSMPDIGIHEVVSSTGNQPPVIANQTFTVAENSSNGTSVGQVIANDPNAGQTLTYTITAGNTSNAFTINASTGALAVANSSALNYEAIPSFALTVQVQDNGTGNLTASASITVNLSNVNEYPVMNGLALSINENTATGTQIGVMVATDPDQGQQISYSITSGNTNSAFAINATTGAISVNSAAALNYEVQSSFSLVVRAQDNGTPSLGTNANLQITIVNVNESPVINNQTFNVPSNSPNGTSVGIVSATDPDLNQVLSYSITAGNTGTGFAINSGTGAITIANSTAVNYLVNPIFSLTVRVQDNGSPVLSSYATITINVTPTNNSPIITNQSFTVAENSAQGTSVGQVIASDPDPGQTLSYTLVSGNTGNTFMISTGGLITVANPQLLNYENPVTFQLSVQVTDNGVPQLSSSTIVSIAISNVNENPIVTSNQSFTIAEHVPAGTQVGNVIAIDPDNGQNLTFTIISGNTNNAFAISPSNGMLTVSGTVCYEACSQYSLIIRATDNGSPSLYDQKTVAIILTDVNENPVIGNQSFSVQSYSAVGTVVGTVVANDPDLNQTISYSITSGNSGNTFAINSSTGIITVSNNSILSYITNPVFTLIVRAQDNGVPVLSSSASITITVTPVNTAPSISNQTFTIAENLPHGVIIGTVIASDPDPGQILNYTITSGNTSGAFVLGTNGILSVGNSAAINFETNPVFSLGITVSDNGQPQLSNNAVITINLTNLNEAPIISGNTNFAIDEQVATGTVVGTVTASDPDAGQTLIYSIISGNTDNVFTISSTGVITVNGNINYETINLYSLSIRVTDNGSPVLYDQENFVIQINDVNEQPLINNQVFNTIANAPNGTIVGTVAATDPDLNQLLSFAIISGNVNGAFTLNTSTGVLSVANSSALNPVTNPVFALNVRVQDNGNPVLSSFATISVTLNNTNSAPVIVAQTFSTLENQPVGYVVGTVLASDPNAGQTLTFSIISGNTDYAFAISQSGVLTINNADVIDFETHPSFSLTVMVADNGSPVLTSQAIVNINILNANDPPLMLPQTYIAKENIPNGRYVCKVLATDQDPGDTYQFNILSGNTNNAFKMQAYTGRIFVNNAAALNYELIPVFYLTVKAYDNHGAFSTQIITIEIEDVNEAPVILNQSFSVAKNAPNGTVIGTVVASDPDNNQTLKYSITQGNTSGIFAIGLLTGQLTVANSTALQNTTVNSFLLTIKVKDNGSPVLSSNGYATIVVTRNKETGELTAETNPERLNLLLSVYPNPSSDGIFNVKMKEEVIDATTITITDITGKKVGEANSTGEMNFRLDLGYLPSGVYLMHAQSAQKQTVVKLIRQ